MIHLSPPMNLELTITRPLTVPLSKGFVELESLEHLSLTDCKSLTALPAGIHSIISIYFIWHRHDPFKPPLNLGLTVAPTLNHSLSEGFGELESLQTLNLELCISLTSLPAGMHTIISIYFIVTVMIHLSPPMNLGLTITPILNCSTIRRFRRVGESRGAYPHQMQGFDDPARRYV